MLNTKKNLSFLDCKALEAKYLCKIVVVSKKQNIKTIKSAYDQGFRHFAESYAQEAFKKQKDLKNICPDIIWHFVGNIQSNKLKDICANFLYLHSVSSLKLVNKIIKYQEDLSQNQHQNQNSSSNNNSNNSKILNIFLQINISKDPKKSGFVLETDKNNQEFLESIKQINAVSKLCFKGFMTMPFLYPDKNSLSKDFKKMQTLSDHYSKLLKKDLQNSMGTSNDYLLALKAGAKWIRLGESILGKRR